MESLTQWVATWVMMSLLALFWLCYLVRMVLQDESAMEKKRRQMRIREERRREIEDQEAAKRQHQAQRKRAAARQTP